MDSILEKLRADMTSFPGHLSVEITERERLKEQLHAAYASEPVDLKEVDSIMSYELNRRSALANSREMTLQVSDRLAVLSFCLGLVVDLRW